MHTCFQQAFKQSSCHYLVKYIQLASGEEGLQPMEWGAYLLVASEESKVQLLDITTCTSKGALVQTQNHVISVKGLRTSLQGMVLLHDLRCSVATPMFRQA
jgi:uncharacterized caspase-like protein